MFVQTAKNAARVLKIAKAASKAKTASKAAKVAKTTKPAKTAVKGFGDNKAYARLEDMKRSEFYRDRHNAGKTYSEPDSKTMKKIKTTASVGATGAGLAYAASQKKKKK